MRILKYGDPKLSFDITSGVESDFRQSYSMYLKHMRQRVYDMCIGFNELEDERRFVNQQVIKTPGRRGKLLRMKKLIKNFPGDLESTKTINIFE